jgi:hypothetical protein
MSKEDIWVSRVPLPVKTDETQPVDDDFSTFAPGAIVPGWNTYRPKWDRVEVTDGRLLLEHRDPYDGASATRVFPASKRATIRFALDIPSAGSGQEVELLRHFGSRRPVRFRPERSGEYVLRVDAAAGRFSVSVDGKPWIADRTFEQPADDVHRITFRTAPYVGIGGTRPVADGTDWPGEPVAYRIRRLHVGSA